jgi:LysM repeat protein
MKLMLGFLESGMGFKMRFNRRYSIWVMLFPAVILLTGCFQQAGESFQPVNTNPASNPPAQNTAIPPQTSPNAPENTATPVEISTENSASSVGPTNSVAITVISPTRVQPPTDTLEALPTATESQFRTPFSPLGPVPTDTPASGLITEPLTSTPSGLITPTALAGANSADGCTHTVQPGETLFRIALKNGITVPELQKANPQISGDLIHPGDVLNIPGCSSTGTAVVTPVEQTPLAPVGGTTYVVQRGDTLFAIAQRFGVTMKAIQDANHLPDPNHLSIGQQLIIPPRSG